MFFRYGFSNMRYIASLISGVGIFMMGAGLSWYHGIMGLLHPQPIESLLWVSFSICNKIICKGLKKILTCHVSLLQAYCILAGSLVSEGGRIQ